jgi:hypothetical protein
MLLRKDEDTFVPQKVDTQGKFEPAAAVGRMTKSNEIVTIFSCHFARKSKKTY